MQFRTLSALVVLAVTQVSMAQWKEAHKIAQGGESTVASDGKGTVYVTAHGPAALYKSSDWGANFTLLKAFDDAQCDLCVVPLPNGTMHTMYLRNGVIGIGTWFSTDNGKTLTRGQNIDGDLDREWIALNPATGKIFMDYSNGYIGGPKSKGVYCVTSVDNSKSFTPPVRVDREPDGSYGVDPYMTRLESGRIICMWQVSTDYNTIDAYRTAYSDDDGKTFSDPITVAEFPKKVRGQDVDTQERWVLGAILATGKNDVIVDYPGYESVDVDGKSQICFLQHYKVSHDGGATYGPGQTVLGGEELKDAVRTFMKNSGENLDYARYIENLPWLAADAMGNVHMVFTDNRDGASSTMIAGKPLANWRVRHTTMKSFDKGFERSEAVSGNYAAKRPPMDFISCSADSKYVYASWTETPGSGQDWRFTGDLWVGRKPLK
jgi:hypothetical protein